MGEFEICLRDVFINYRYNIEFSNTVRFRRGYDKYICNNNWIKGLPCIDDSKFFHGAYDYSGFNYGRHYGNYYKNVFEFKIYNNNPMDKGLPIARWEVLTGCIFFVFCVI